MKKKNRFLANKTFVVFSILAVCIILTAVFAPVVTRGVDPLKGSFFRRRDDGALRGTGCACGGSAHPRLS